MSKRSIRWWAALCLVVVLGGGTLAWRLQALRRPTEATLVAAGRLREAQLVLRDAMAREPNAPGPHVRMGGLQLKLADPVAAEKEFRRAGALGATPDTVLPGLARALLLQQRHGEVLRLVPASGATPAIAARNLQLRAEAQLAQGNAQAAERSLALSRVAAPDEVDTFLTAAKVAAAGGGPPRSGNLETEALTDEVLRRDPANLDALLLKVRMVARHGDRTASRAAIERALAGS